MSQIKGKISQIGAPIDIYEKPSNKFVADFIGMSNFLKLNKLATNGSSIQLSFNDIKFSLVNEKEINSDQISGVLRPEHIIFNTNNNDDNIIGMEGVVEIISYQGALIRYIINANGTKFISEISNLPGTKRYQEGEKINFGFDKNNLVLI